MRRWAGRRFIDCLILIRAHFGRNHGKKTEFWSFSTYNISGCPWKCNHSHLLSFIFINQFSKLRSNVVEAFGHRLFQDGFLYCATHHGFHSVYLKIDYSFIVWKFYQIGEKKTFFSKKKRILPHRRNEFFLFLTISPIFCLFYF